MIGPRVCKNPSGQWAWGRGRAREEVSGRRQDVRSVFFLFPVLVVLYGREREQFSGRGVSAPEGGFSMLGGVVLQDGSYVLTVLLPTTTSQ